LASYLRFTFKTNIALEVNFDGIVCHNALGSLTVLHTVLPSVNGRKSAGKSCHICRDELDEGVISQIGDLGRQMSRHGHSKATETSSVLEKF
jgi:hypothetical protein